jgi:hypothetical protein
MPQHYRVSCFQFGPYPRGSVIPDHVAGNGNKIADLIAHGTLAPTAEPVNVTIVDKPAPPSQVPDELRDQLREATNRHTELESRHLLALGEVDRLTGRVKVLEAEVLRKTEECGHWQTQCGEMEKAMAELHKELEQATAPAE